MTPGTANLYALPEVADGCTYEYFLKNIVVTEHLKSCLPFWVRLTLCPLLLLEHMFEESWQYWFSANLLQCSEEHENSFVERKRKDARKTALTQNCIGPKYHNCKVNTDFTSWWYSQARQCVCGHVNSFGHSCLWNPSIVDVYGHFHDLRVVAGLMLRHTFEYHRSPNRRPYSTGIRGPWCNWRYLKWSRRNGKNDP